MLIDDDGQSDCGETMYRIWFLTFLLFQMCFCNLVWAGDCDDLRVKAGIEVSDDEELATALLLIEKTSPDIGSYKKAVAEQEGRVNNAKNVALVREQYMLCLKKRLLTAASAQSKKAAGDAGKSKKPQHGALSDTLDLSSSSNDASEGGGEATKPESSSPQAISIAVLPFLNEANGVELGAIIESDLVSSGRMVALPRAREIQRVSDPRSVDFQPWRGANVRYLVIGSVMQGAPQMSARFFLLDVNTGEQMLAFDLPIPSAARSRYVAHQIADMIYQKLFNHQGSFNTKMAYVAVEEVGSSSTYYLRVADIDGYDPRILAQSREPLMSPAWSPDRKRLAFAGYEKGQTAIYIQTLATAAIKRVFVAPGINGTPTWSPTGTHLAISYTVDDDVEIAVVDLDRQQHQRLTNSKGADSEPSWSANGSAIAFTSEREGKPQVYLMGIDGRGQRRVSVGGQMNKHPSFSPDGKLLAMTQSDGSGDRIAVLDIQQQTVRLISDGPKDAAPSFSPNGDALLYAAGGNSLIIIDLDGQIGFRLQDAASLREPSWSPLLRP